MADPAVLATLLERLSTVEPGSRRRWGSLTPHEMLYHLGDATAMVLGARPATIEAVSPSRGARGQGPSATSHPPRWREARPAGRILDWEKPRVSCGRGAHAGQSVRSSM